MLVLPPCNMDFGSGREKTVSALQGLYANCMGMRGAQPNALLYGLLDGDVYQPRFLSTELVQVGLVVSPSSLPTGHETWDG